MSSNPLCDRRIVESWGKNAEPWTRAVREKQIDSRRQVTDQAIVEAVLSRSPKSLLDIGCGEGWLARELSARHIDVLGVDVTAQLIEEARRAGGGEFRVISYEDIAAGRFKASVDAAVCNFALPGKESVDSLFRSIASLLNGHGSFVVQTLHPVMACGDHPYRDGWREGSWDGFSSDFTDPAPWYFRTLESRIRLFTKNNFRMLDLRNRSIHRQASPLPSSSSPGHERVSAPPFAARDGPAPSSPHRAPSPTERWTRLQRCSKLARNRLLRLCRYGAMGRANSE